MPKTLTWWVCVEFAISITLHSDREAVSKDRRNTASSPLVSNIDKVELNIFNMVISNTMIVVKEGTLISDTWWSLR